MMATQSFVLFDSLFNCIHDNLACHKQFGLARGFNTKYPCAICFEDADSQQILYSESDKLRQPDFYALLGNVQYSYDLSAIFGLYERTPFDLLKYYLIGESMTCDPFHDLEEGIVKDVLHAMFESLYRPDKKLITKEGITARAKSFDYGDLDLQYRPRSYSLEKKGFGLSAVQLRNFLLRFLFIYGDLENDDNKAKFDIIRYLIIIRKFCYSNYLTEGHLQLVEDVIRKFLEGDLSSTRSSIHKTVILDQESFGFTNSDNIFELDFHHDQCEFRSDYIVSKVIDVTQFFRIKRVIEVNGKVTLQCSTINTIYDADCVSFKIVGEEKDSLMYPISEFQVSQTYNTVFSQKNHQQYILTKCLL